MQYRFAVNCGTLSTRTVLCTGEKKKLFLKLKYLFGRSKGLWGYEGNT